MKIFKFIFLFLFAFLVIFTSQCLADTGTYRILNYKVTLTPHPTGEVEIDYYQKWLVTDEYKTGHIPWITVGVPNSNFDIKSEKSRGAIKAITSANEGSWSSVRIDLDKDYKPNETFEVWFSTVQHKLFYADDKNYKLEFTPGWYDQALIDNLTIEIISFAKIDQIYVSPAPTLKQDQKIVWEKKNLAKGERLKVSISFPKSLAQVKNTEVQRNTPDFVSILLLLGVFVFIIIVMIYLPLDEGRHGYSGGNYYLGGFGRGGSSGGTGERSSGGGGGFGGRAFSCVACACACVSCACACACAGGGGAGCSRKIDHDCPICKPSPKKLRKKASLRKIILPIFILLLSVNFGLGIGEQPYDSNVTVPKGDPPFTALGEYWVIDNAKVLSKETIIKVDTICQKLKEDAVAEVVVLIQNNIKHPEEYATHYGRWLRLGEKGFSVEGGNNGIVWLIRPDADSKMTISVGRGLPKFTTMDYGDIMDKAKDYIYFNNYDAGVLLIVTETDRKIRELYERRKE